MAGGFFNHLEDRDSESEEDREDDAHRCVIFEASGTADGDDEKDAEKTGDGSSDEEAGEVFSAEAEP